MQCVDIGDQSQNLAALWPELRVGVHVAEPLFRKFIVVNSIRHPPPLLTLITLGPVLIRAFSVEHWYTEPLNNVLIRASSDSRQLRMLSLTKPQVPQYEAAVNECSSNRSNEIHLAAAIEDQTGNLDHMMTISDLIGTYSSSSMGTLLLRLLFFLLNRISLQYSSNLVATFLMVFL